MWGSRTRRGCPRPWSRPGAVIATVYTGGPGLVAMPGGTVAEAAPGKFVLGIGTSSPVIVQGWNGMAFDEPFARARDTLRFLRKALAGEKVSESYPTFT